MKHSLLQAHVVVRTLKVKNFTSSRGKLHQWACRTCTTSFFFSSNQLRRRRCCRRCFVNFLVLGQSLVTIMTSRLRYIYVLPLYVCSRTHTTIYVFLLWENTKYWVLKRRPWRNYTDRRKLILSPICFPIVMFSGLDLKWCTWSFLFAGYGNIAPLSDGGKVFCMVFAVFGIPMTAIMLTALVERLLQLADYLEKFMSSTCTVRGIPPAYLRCLHLSIIMCGAVILVIVLPAFFFKYMEDWSYFEALYFCFISLTTIGLGDFVPGDDPRWRKSDYRPLYKVCCVFFFITGLTFLLLIQIGRASCRERV